MELSPESRDLTTIITGFWKFRYNRAPMGLCAYGDIFQAKVDEILIDIEVVEPYIEYIIVLGKGSFSRHIYHLMVIFSSICVTGVKVNDPKCSFGLK